MVDLGHRKAQISKVTALAQHREDIGLHGRQFVLHNADLVLATGRRDD